MLLPSHLLLLDALEIDTDQFVNDRTRNTLLLNAASHASQVIEKRPTTKCFQLAQEIMLVAEGA